MRDTLLHRPRYLRCPACFPARLAASWPVRRQPIRATLKFRGARSAQSLKQMLARLFRLPPPSLVCPACCRARPAAERPAQGSRIRVTLNLKAPAPRAAMAAPSHPISPCRSLRRPGLQVGPQAPPRCPASCPADQGRMAVQRLLRPARGAPDRTAALKSAALSGPESRSNAEPNRNTVARYAVRLVLMLRYIKPSRLSLTAASILRRWVVTTSRWVVKL